MTTMSDATSEDAFADALAYVQGQRTTGFLVQRDGVDLVARNWPAPADQGPFAAAFMHGVNAAGELLEDVASQQKSFVGMLAAIAVDKGLLDVEAPVSDIVGAGWSNASPAQEAAIRVVHLLTMASGLGEDFTYAAAPGTRFLYNTPVYAVAKQVLAAAAGASLEDITRDWLAGPAGMVDTAWRIRPAAMGDVGNPTGLVTTPSDVARFGRIVLDGGLAADGARMVSEAALNAMLAPTAINPAYGRLWWRNGGAFAVRPLDRRVEGPLIPSAPADLVAALGALDRKLYVVPSQRLVVVRLGLAAPDASFDESLWRLLGPALDALPH